MATNQSQRDATVILTDSSKWIPWYRQIKMQCEALEIWDIVDPAGNTQPRTKPTEPLPPLVSDYEPAAALRNTSSAPSSSTRTARANARAPTQDTVDIVNPAVQTPAIPARYSELSAEGKEAYDGDSREFKMVFESYKIRERNYRDERTNIAAMIRHLNATVSPHLQVSCFEEHGTLRTWITNLQVAVGVDLDDEIRRVRERYHDSLRPMRSPQNWESWLSEYDQAATRAEALKIGDVIQSKLVVDDFLKAVSKIAPRLRNNQSRLETLGAAVSQATTFESQFFESQTEEEGAAEGSQAGTAATTEASVDTEPDNGDNFDGINWDRLPRFMKPLTTGRRVKSWIFQHGYRVVELYDQNRVWFVCKYCHIHKVIDTGGSGVFDVSKATSSAAAHLGLQKRGHGFTKDGLKPRRTGQQLSLRQTLETGVAVSQEAANAMGNFNIQQFREVAVFCLLDNNLPMELLARPSFREMISLANPEAEAALWVSPRSVATYAMRLFQYMQPQIVCALSEAASKIHISFDGWTTKGGKRGFFGVVAHFANASGVIQDLPIALPHLAGSHTGDAIADTIKKTLQEYSIGSDKLGYFVLDNAANNDTAVSSLAHAYDFNAAHRRLRCGPHTLNLIGQAIIFGSNQEAYNNNNDEQLQTEEVYMQEWRQEGPLGVLIDVINHIKTPQQHEIFRSFQTAANAELPARERLHVLEPVKPVVTRWNSYYAAFKRATQLQAAYNSYAEHYINALSLEDRRACQRGNKLPEAPSWMRSTGLTAADWAVITEYQDCLEPLKLATEKLEGRGKAGKYGAIYETIPVFEYVLGALEARTRSYEQVDFNPPDAPEDHLFVNLRAAWSKANDYYNKLDRSPAYYAATCLHPYYKYYCENSWVDKPEWLTSANAGFLQLWQSYKPQRTRPLSQTTAKPRHRGIDDVIGALVRRNKAQVEAAHDDEYERWRTQEPEWTSEQYLSDGHPVKYWIQLRSKYPCLSQFAIDILTIPASSCDCERLFSELGDLLEPRRRALGSELLAALQLVRSWRRAGFDGLYNNGDDEDKWSDVKDEEIVQQYDIEGWTWMATFTGAGSDRNNIERRQMMKLFREHMSLAHPTRGKSRSAFMTGEAAYAASGESDSNTQGDASSVQIRAPSTNPSQGNQRQTNKRKMNAPGNKSKQFQKRNTAEAGDICPACEQRHDISSCYYVNPTLETPDWFKPNKHITKLVQYKLQHDADLQRIIQETNLETKRPRLTTASRSITPYIKTSQTPDSVTD
ncbi:Dimer-Tnp-hAT domain-containing protein [Pyrenophora tritici-repentis]|nr:Dimer-Tnp-hAT domain-containing protein [Pyrenophora tritici-repentis]